MECSNVEIGNNDYQIESRMSDLSDRVWIKAKIKGYDVFMTGTLLALIGSLTQTHLSDNFPLKFIA